MKLIQMYQSDLHAAMLWVSMSLEGNSSTLYTYSYIYTGINALIKTSEFGDTSAKINVDKNLLEWIMLRSHAAFVLEVSSRPFPDAFMRKGKSPYRLIPQN